MDISYLITPFIAWFIAGCSKFAINCLREKRLAFDLIGYGGMPSNHSCIVWSAATMIYLKEGSSHPALVVAIALAFIVMLDASSLRKQVGKQAQAINQLQQTLSPPPANKLRERMGHSLFELLIGMLLGIASAWLTLKISAFLVS